MGLGNIVQTLGEAMFQICLRVTLRPWLKLKIRTLTRVSPDSELKYEDAAEMTKKLTYLAKGK